MLRVLSVLAGLIAGGVVAWFSAPGQQFAGFVRETIVETKKVVWPSRKETLQTTGIVFVFMVCMAFFSGSPTSPSSGCFTTWFWGGGDMSKRWYVVHAYSGFEKSVQRALIERIARAGMEDMFGQILVPVEEVVEMKSGQKSISERKFFPGYVLVEMEMNDESWHLVKSTRK